MIRVDRASVPAPASLTKADGAGAKERAKAALHYADGNNEAFEFSAYKSADVVEALRRLFANKCAYCETHYAAATGPDIEHFRPKGAIAADDAHPGYWWVAMAWENLLPSCPDCNRPRKQTTVPLGMSYQAFEELVYKRGDATSGKATLFPIQGPRTQPQSVDFDSEDPLLIDPTRHDPAEHLAFVTDLPEKQSIVVAPQVGGTPDPYGDMSIKVYGLNRVGLVQARTMLLTELRTKETILRTLLEQAAAATTPEARKALNDAAVFQYRGMEKQAAPNSPYSALAAAFIADVKRRLELGM